MEGYSLATLRKPESVAQVGKEDIALHNLFGADLTRVSNLSFIEDDVILYVSGNSVVFENINTGNKDYLMGIDEIGVGAVAVHPSRTLLAIGGKGYQPNVYIYEYPSLKICKVLRGGTDRTYASLSFTEEGDKIATVGGNPDYMLTVWDWQEEKIILHSKAFGQDVFSVRFSQDDERRLTTSGTGHIRFWKMVATFTGQKLQGSIGKFGKIELSDIAAFAELPDGKVVSGTESGDLLLWEGNFIKCRFINDSGSRCHRGNIHHIILDRESGCVISAGADGYIRWWSFSIMDSAEVDSDNTMDFSLTPINEYYLGDGCGVKYFITNVVEDESRFVVQDVSGRLLVIRHNLSSSKVRGIPSNATCDVLGYFSAGPFTGLETNSMQHLAVTSGADGFVRLWDYVNRKMVCFRQFPSPASCLSWVPSTVDKACRMVAVGFEDGVVRVLTVFRREGNPDLGDEGSYEMYKQMLFKPHGCAVVALSFSPDGDIFCTAGADGTVFFFDTTTLTYDNNWTPLRFIQLPSKVSCERLSWRKNGGLICSCSDGIGRIVNLATLRRLIGVDSSSMEISSYEVEMPIAEISLALEIKSAAVPLVSPSKGASSDSAEAVAEEATTAPPSPDKAAATVTKVPLRISNITEGANGMLCAGAAYGQTNTFIVIQEDLVNFNEYPIGLYSKDGKGYLKNPAVTSISRSRSGNFTFVGTKDGAVVVRPEEYFETFARVVAHNEQCGGVSAIACSFDDTFLISAGRDGVLTVHRMRPSSIIGAAEPLAKDIRAGVYDTQVERDAAKVQVVEPKFLFKVNPLSDLEGFGDLPKLLCEDEDFIEATSAAAIPEGREAAELEPGTYSIQDAKLKSEDDARKLTADDKKENVRKLVRQLQREYTDVLEKVRKIPKEITIPKENLVVDDAYFQLLAKEEAEKVAEAHRDCEYQAAVSSTLRKKITERLMDGIIVEDMIIKGFKEKNPPVVHSLRTRDLNPSVWTALESIRDMVRLEEVEAAKSRASQVSMGEQIKAAHGQGSVGAGGASAAGTEHPGGGEDSLDGSNPQQNSNLNSTRSEHRKQRKEELKKHNTSKPREDEDDTRDVEAIMIAEKTIGSYKLKIADDYQVPEDQRVNADKKKRQIVMLEDSILSLKTQFNERFLALRHLKKQIIDDIMVDQCRVDKIDTELETPLIPAAKIRSRKNDPKEYPDDRDEVTPKELEHFKEQAKSKGFDKIVPMAHSTVTGIKTQLNGGARSHNFAGSPTKKYSETISSNFQSFIMDGNSSLGHTQTGQNNGNGSRTTKPAADQFLSKYYPDDVGLDDLEANVAVLAAAKENLGQLNKGQVQANQNFLTAERQRLLLHERDSLVKKTERHTVIFDEAVDELRLERHSICVNLKQAELKLIVLYQEYMQLLTFETRDNALQQKHAKCMREKGEIISGTLDLQGKMEVKLDELKTWNEKAEQVLASFHALVPATYPFAEQLLKIFKKKIKRNKNAGIDNGDEEDFEEEDEDEDEDDDLDDEEVEDACPPGCDMVIYDKVLDLREKRLDIDEVTNDVIKIVDDLKKSSDRLKTREKQIDKDAKMTESEIQQFQLQKQIALNQIDVYLPIHLSQVYAFTTSGELSGPVEEQAEAEVPADGASAGESLNHTISEASVPREDLVLIPEIESKSHVLMNNCALERVQQRIGELRFEIDTAKHDLRRLHKEKGAFSKQREAQKSKIDIWKEKVDELMSMKFGRVIDLDELEKGSDRTIEESAQKELERQEQKAIAELAKLSTEAFELKSEIAEATKRNTDLLQKVAELAENKLKLTRELNAPTGGVASATQGVGLDETSDRAELKSFSVMQLREIDALRNEITSLRRKDAPLLLSSTMPNPVSRSSSARNQPDSAGGLFPPIPSSRRSNASR